VNLLLVEPAEVGPDGACAIDGDRARHVRDVLGARAGSVVRAGVIGGGVGAAEVVADDGARMTLRLTITGAPPPQLPIELVLAVPRPKVVTRTIETCAAFGVRRVDLTNAWRVDKSYFDSPRLAPDALARAARLGAAQGATTHLPELHVHDRLMALLDTRFPALGGPLALRLVAHPGAPPLERVVTTSGPAIVAIGPEGGWIERELDTFVARGFAPVSLAATILRTETAVAAALAQLALLVRARARPE